MAVLISIFIYTGKALPPTGGVVDKFPTTDGSKYKTSPTTPTKAGRFLTILPKGLTLKFPSSGVFADVTIPAMLKISALLAPVTFTN
jgi:hypothetical protein